MVNTSEWINDLLKAHNSYVKEIEKFNNILLSRKIRKINFPSEISENIAKASIDKYYNVNCNWNVKTGDLIIGKKKIEVKCFSSSGPTSFGPTESWDYICFVDAREHSNNRFKVYFCKTSNNSDYWKNIKVNKIQSFEDQCKQKRRPRLDFHSIKKQISLTPCKFKKIFDGNITDLFFKK
jgi:hypothetical protein